MAVAKGYFGSTYLRGDGAVALTNDAADPNTAAIGVEAAGTLLSPQESAVNTARSLWLWAKTAAPTVTVWLYDLAVARWVPLSTGLACPITGPTKIPVPFSARIYVEVTAHGGCTQLTGGWGPV